ncbi:hypothetical protein ACFSJ3_04400 [Corallincola platygyrae]|uniref:Uncharacterized protein n=1 Tax=Corallincola platygyrae TaxID=1193278 RepID=A0ABW4XKD8_9GAMM
MRAAGIWTLIVVAVWSGNVAAEAGWLPAAQIKSLTVSHHGRYMVELDSSKTLKGCSQPNMYFIDFDALGAEQSYQMLLEASIAKRPVQLYITGRCALKGISEVSSVRLPAP